MRQLLICLLVFWGCAGAIRNANGQTAAEPKPVQVSGAVSLRGIYHQMDGVPDARKPLSYLLTGNSTISAYGVQVPVSFILSSQGNSFRQSFNQFGLSPTFKKKVTVHLGYRNINFSQFTLAGHTILGGGMEATPGKWRLGIMAGRLNRATTLDTATAVLAPVAFTRTAIAVKIGYGNANQFVDLSFLRAQDNPNSLKVNRDELYASRLPQVYAGQNLVGGLNSRFSFFDKKLRLETEAALSVFTDDINNELDPRGRQLGAVTRGVNQVIVINGTSGLSVAGQTSLGYFEKLFSVRLQYRRVDPGFRSMGAYFLNNDLENFTLVPSFSAWKRKIRFQGSIGFQRDNLKKQKQATGNRLIGSANLGADLTDRLGVDLSFINYSIDQKPQTTRFADTLRVTQTTQNLSVNPRYLVTAGNNTHLVLLSANYSTLKDFNKLYADNAMSRDLRTQNYFLNYSLTFGRQSLSLNAGLNYSDLENNQLRDNNRGVVAGVNKTLSQGKFSLALNGGYLQNKRNEENSTIINGSFAVSWTPVSHHLITFNTYYTSNTPVVDTGIFQQRYSELRGEIMYQYSF